MLEAHDTRPRCHISSHCCFNIPQKCDQGWDVLAKHHKSPVLRPPPSPRRKKRQREWWKPFWEEVKPLRWVADQESLERGSLRTWERQPQEQPLTLRPSSLIKSWMREECGRGVTPNQDWWLVHESRTVSLSSRCALPLTYRMLLPLQLRAYMSASSSVPNGKGSCHVHFTVPRV